MLGWTGWRKRMEKKMDDALALLRASATREEEMGQDLEVLLTKVTEISTAIDENAQETAEVIELLKAAQEDPAKVQEAIDRLTASQAKLTATNDALKQATGDVTPPAPEPQA